jgi:ligand-binding sensor domain-containing protein
MATGPLAIDSTGGKWIGTFSSGVVRFSKNKWKTFDTSDTKLPSNWVQVVGAEPSGSVWATAWGIGMSGLSRYNGTTWTPVTSKAGGWSGGQIRAMGFQSNGTAWFGTTDKGVDRYDGTTWTNFDTSKNVLPSTTINAIAVGSQNVIWFGTGDSGIIKYNGTAWVRYTSKNSGLPNNKIVDNALCVQKNGTVWIGTVDSGLVSFDGNSWKRYGQSDGLFGMIHCVAIDSSNNVWAGAGTGIAKFNGTTWKYYSSLASKSSDTYYPGASTPAISFDKSGTFWAISQGLITCVFSNAVYYTFRPEVSQSKLQIHSNPLNGVVTIRVPNETPLSYVKIFDLKGVFVRSLNVEHTAVSDYTDVTWNSMDSFGKPAQAGTYLFRIVGSTSSITGSGYIHKTR